MSDIDHPIKANKVMLEDNDKYESHFIPDNMMVS